MRGISEDPEEMTEETKEVKKPSDAVNTAAAIAVIVIVGIPFTALAIRLGQLILNL